MLPKSGDVLRVTKKASVQFLEPMLFRVIRMHDWPTYDGWAWLDGYQLNAAGDAVARRSIFVQLRVSRTLLGLFAGGALALMALSALGSLRLRGRLV